MRNFARKHKENICAKVFFLVFCCEFCEICKNTFFCRTAPDDYLVSIVTKEVLVNKTVDYDTKTKAYVLV